MLASGPAARPLSRIGSGKKRGRSAFLRFGRCFALK